MNVASQTVPRWAVSTRTRGEVLVAGVATPALELVLLGVPSQFSQSETEDWLRDLAEVAAETARDDASARALPPVLYHALAGLLFSQAELWASEDAASPCAVAFLESGDHAAFGWMGEAVVQVAINGEPIEPEWIIVRDEDGREARGILLDAGAHVQTLIEYSAGHAPSAEPPAAVEAEWSRTGGARAPAPSVAVPAPNVGERELPAEAAASSAAPAQAAMPEVHTPAVHEHAAIDQQAEDDEAHERALAEAEDDTTLSPEQSLALGSLTAPRESHPVARWLGRLLGFARSVPAAMRRSSPAPDHEATPLSTYDSMLSDSVPATPALEQTALARDASALHPPASAEAERAPTRILAALTVHEAAQAEAAAPSAPHPPAIGSAPPTLATQRALQPLSAPAPPAVPAAPEASPPVPALESMRERLVRAMDGVDSDTLPVLHVPMPAPTDAPAPPLSVDHEPVGADATFAIPSITSRGSAPGKVTVKSAGPPAAAPPAPPAAPAIPTAAAAPAAPAPTAAPAPGVPAASAMPVAAGPPAAAPNSALPTPSSPPPTPTPPAPLAIVPPAKPTMLKVRATPGPAAAPPVLRLVVPGQQAIAPPVMRVPATNEDPASVLLVEPASVPSRIDDPALPVFVQDIVTAEAAEAAEAGAPRRRWPELVEPAKPGFEVSRRTWVLVGIMLGVFMVGWLVGVIANPQPDQPGPITRFMRAIGLGGAHYLLAVNSNPVGAWIAIDGKDVAKRTPSDVEVSPGPHTVTLSLPDLGSAEVAVRGRAGERISLSPSLNGTLDIQSSDAGVPLSVSLDGRALGYAPLQVDALAPGLHEVQLSGPGMPAWAQTVQVGVRQTAQLVAHPMSAPATGVIQVQATLNDEQGATPLSGAQIWVDGDLRAVTPTALELARGPHSLKLTWHGHAAPVQVIDLPGGNERFASFAFGLDPGAPQVALLGGVHPANVRQQAVVSAALTGLQLGDVRESWLHVRMPDGLWRRYPMTATRGSRGPIVTCGFPSTGFDAQGQSRWYLSASTLQGDEYFSEMQVATVGGGVRSVPRPAKAGLPAPAAAAKDTSGH